MSAFADGPCNRRVRASTDTILARVASLTRAVEALFAERVSARQGLPLSQRRVHPLRKMPADDDRRSAIAARSPPRRLKSLQRERDVGLRRRLVQPESSCLDGHHPGARGRPHADRLKPCSQSASARDGACRSPSGGFTRSGRCPPTTIDGLRSPRDPPPRRLKSLQRERDVGLRRRLVQPESSCLDGHHPGARGQPHASS
jgi:hypothetical protein